MLKLRFQPGLILPIVYKEITQDCLAVLTIRGQLRAADYAAVLPLMTRLIDRCGNIKVIEVVESFAGFTDDIPPAGPDVQALMRKISHVALVSNIGWYCPILSDQPAEATIKIRSFSLSDLDLAYQWVNATPV